LLQQVEQSNNGLSKQVCKAVSGSRRPSTALDVWQPATHLPIGLPNGAHLEHALHAGGLVEGRVDDAGVFLPQCHPEAVHLRAVQPRQWAPPVGMKLGFS